MVRCPGSSKKSHFHRVILGFGPCPGFDAADLRADTIPAGFPPPPSGLKPRSVLCCPTENMKYGSQRKSRDPKGLQSRAIPSCYPPQHIPFSVSVIWLFPSLWRFPFLTPRCICCSWSSCTHCVVCALSPCPRFVSPLTSPRSGPVMHGVRCNRTQLTAHYYFCDTSSFTPTLVLSWYLKEVSCVGRAEANHFVVLNVRMPNWIIQKQTTWFLLCREPLGLNSQTPEFCSAPTGCILFKKRTNF